MRKSFLLPFLFCLLIPFLASCDKHEANLRTFSNAIEKYLETKVPVPCIPNQFPHKVRRDAPDFPIYEELTRYDVLSYDGTVFEDDRETLTSYKITRVRKYIFDMRLLGRRFIFKGSRDGKYVEFVGFGEPELLSIIHATPPKKYNNVEYSNVTFRWHVTNIPPWVQSQNFKKAAEKLPAFHELLSQYGHSKPKTETITLIHTREGWMPQSLVKKATSAKYPHLSN
ncbi:MAG: hypothetical protein J5803_03815 [Desulfovibrio sp.]|nr:hypothetical protein [Desulfovibrio sp.]